MFNIHGRHSPMFNTSDFKKITDSLSRFFDLKTKLSKVPVECVPLHQTVRINENNSFILKSVSGNSSDLVSDLKSLLVDDKGESHNSLMADYLKYLINNYSIGKIQCTSSEKTELLPSQEKYNVGVPGLIILNSTRPLSKEYIEEIAGTDFFALWPPFQNIEESIVGSETYFSIRPSVKLETSLNRFTELIDLSDFSVGMVRF